MEHSVYAFNITVIKFKVNIACYKYSADTQHTACTNTQYHAVYTADTQQTACTNTQYHVLYRADTQYTACTNTQYLALHLTGDPRSCSFRFHSAVKSKFSKTNSSTYFVPRTILWSVVWTSSRPHSCRLCRGLISTCSRRCKTHHWHSSCSYTHSPSSSSTWELCSYKIRLMQTAESGYVPGRFWCELHCAVPLKGVKINCASYVLF